MPAPTAKSVRLSAALLLVAGCGRFAGGASSSAVNGTAFAGCTAVVDDGPFAVRVTYDFPPDGDQVKILRNDVLIFQTVNPKETTFVDRTVAANETYKYSCNLEIDGRGYPGAKEPTITVADPLKDYDGCVAVEAAGADAAKLSFQFPAGATKAIVARNGVDVFSTSDPAVTSAVGDGLEPGKVYVFTCRIELDGKVREGPAQLTFAIPDPLAATFFGCRVATALDAKTVRIEYEFPERTDVITIVRNGVVVFSAAGAGSGTFDDTGLEPGSRNAYVCQAASGLRVQAGTNAPTVTTPKLPALTYKSDKATLIVGQAIAVAPASLEGFGLAITGCRLDPAGATLPDGMSLDPGTCVIGGTPVKAATATAVVVAATAAGEAPAATIKLIVQAGAPSLAPSAVSDVAAAVGVALSAAPLSVAANGSPVTNCHLTIDSPDLPAGLALDALTCALAGTPTAPMGRTLYRAVAENAVGSSPEADFSLSVAP